MRRRTLLTIAVVSLILISGCSSFIQSSNSGHEQYQQETLEGVETHQKDTLDAKDGYKSEAEVVVHSVDNSEEIFSATASYTIDNKNQEAYAVTNYSEATIKQFTSFRANATYRYENRDGTEPMIESSRKPYSIETVDTELSSGDKFVFSEQINYSQRTTGETDDYQFARFKNTEIENVQLPLLDNQNSDLTIESMESEVRVTKNSGIIRHATISATFTDRTGDEYEYEATYQLTEIGSQSIERADWLNESPSPGVGMGVELDISEEPVVDRTDAYTVELSVLENGDAEQIEVRSVGGEVLATLGPNESTGVLAEDGKELRVVGINGENEELIETFIVGTNS